MPKLITPVQFEPSLEGLNEVRPLIMPDECKTLISYPVLCQNLPSEGKPAVGKLARCSQAGALLSNNTEFPDKVYEASLDIETEENDKTYVFSTEVQGVLARVTDLIEETACWWCSSDFQDNYISLQVSPWLFLPFVGRRISFKVVAEEDMETTIMLRGFYR